MRAFVGGEGSAASNSDFRDLEFNCLLRPGSCYIQKVKFGIQLSIPPTLGHGQAMVEVFSDNHIRNPPAFGLMTDCECNSPFSRLASDCQHPHEINFS